MTPFQYNRIKRGKPRLLEGGEATLGYIEGGASRVILCCPSCGNLFYLKDSTLVISSVVCPRPECDFTGSLSIVDPEAGGMTIHFDGDGRLMGLA